jgi:hypothetical protein
MADLMRVIPDPHTRREVRRVLQSWGGHRFYFAVGRERRRERVDLARRMRKMGLAKADCVAALMARLDIARATAYRLVQQADRMP